MKTTTLPSHCLPGALAPAQPVIPRPLWERHQLFQEPQFPDSLGLEDDGPEDDSED
ncbi:hypothetical protein [Streptomyces cylindrosporus]|uniref:Uncharacterized protein n=1 Tax=Streptomyces cylindrosporus TaxID=2927583 RepID=A0ABS9YPH3_9ACTN|nr:hypothetical protein [Streptomyces cylindrosporus]MCI3279178.1 hypothetical protein [Streptomyces cylindrosporus]